MANLDYEMEQGDLTLIGLFPATQASIHNIHGYLLLEAFKFAIEMVNRDSALLGNLSLGYLAIDTSVAPAHAQEGLQAWHRGLRFFNQGARVPTDTNTQAVIGGYSDDVTRALIDSNDQSEPLVLVSILVNSKTLEMQI